MTPSPYDRWADVYDSVYSYVTEDIPFYVGEALEAGGPVLELGCGTGRVSIPMADAGVDVVGLDSSPEMLEVARRKAALSHERPGRLTLVEADMRRLSSSPIVGEFGLVIIPFRGFLALLSVEGPRSEPSRASRPFWPRTESSCFDAFVPDLDMMVQEGDSPYHLRDVSDEETGRRLVLWHQSAYDNHNQIVSARIIVEELDETDTVSRRLYRDFQLRYAHRWEIDHLLARCGYEVMYLFGDYHRSPFDETSTEMVWVAKPRD